MKPQIIWRQAPLLQCKQKLLQIICKQMQSDQNWQQQQIEIQNSMREDQQSIEISTSSNNPSELGQQVKPRPSFLHKYTVSIFLTILGFYFLVFGIIELVTNYSQQSYTVPFTCTQYECKAVFEAFSFSPKARTYLYLINTRFTQNNFQSNTQASPAYPSLTGCMYYRTNGETAKTVAVDNSALVSSADAYPCGEISMYYPENDFTAKNQDTGAAITIKTDGLTTFSFGYQNNKLSTQWADVSASRFAVWSENNIGIGVKKFWGYIEEELPKKIEAKLTAKNPLKESLKSGLSLQINNNEALSGYNIAICVNNFFAALTMFGLGCVSFWLRGDNKDMDADIIDEQDDFTHEIPLSQMQ